MNNLFGKGLHPFEESFRNSHPHGNTNSSHWAWWSGSLAHEDWMLLGGRRRLDARELRGELSSATNDGWGNTSHSFFFKLVRCVRACVSVTKSGGGSFNLKHAL